MKKIRLTLFLLILSFNSLFSQDLRLSFLSIPDSLKDDANAVIRLENTSIELRSSSKMIIKKEMIITIINKLGDQYGNIVINYDKYKKIKNVNARIYNALGIESKKVKKSDFEDISAADGFSLYNDDRIYYYHHIATSYPYTIKYNYEIETANTVFIPGWFPIDGFYVSTEKSNYTLTYPSDIKVKFKEHHLKNYNIEKHISDHKFSYSLKNVKAIKKEPYSTGFLDFTPYVQFAANKFHLAGVDGEASNWEEFGKWMNDKLLKGRNTVPEATKIKIKELVKGVEDPRERARLVYEYMQKKTRYINVSIGIGGWKPMMASEVDKLGYGDCKALTNYTKSLLDVAEVPAYYTVVWANQRRSLDKDLASIQGNHVFLTVPIQKDTLWLECTNQKVPFGYLGPFTDDRDVLMVSPEGGKIIHTKSYSAKESLQLIKGAYSLDEKGNITAQVHIESSGIQYDDNYPVKDYDTKEKTKYYKNFFDHINNIKIEKTEVKNDKKETVFNEDISFKADAYAVNSGNRMLFRINAFNVNDLVPKRIRNRKLPLEIQYGFTDVDEVIIDLPENYKIEAMPDKKRIETKFGSYTTSIDVLNEKQIRYNRELIIKQGLYTVEDYDKYRKFQKKITQQDNSKIVLIKN